MASVQLRQALLAVEDALEGLRKATEHLRAVAAQEPPPMDHVVVRLAGFEDADPTPASGRCCPICPATPGRPCIDVGGPLPEGDYHYGRRNGVPF